MTRLLALIFLVLSSASVQAQAPRSFAYGPHPDQSLDLYAPEGARNAPILVMLHGGGWRRGDKEMDRVWENKVAHWGARGFLFVSVNTRLVPDADPVEQTRDLARAMAFVQAQARGWGGDPDSLILMGHSAGAHVATLLATREDLRRAAGVKRWDGTVVLDTAAVDVPAIMEDRHPRLYDTAFGKDPAFWHAASPIEHVGPREGPFLMVCSSKRREACPAARDFARVARANGVPATVLPVALSHGKINAELGLPSAYTKSVDEWIVRALR
jgi:arylformamidase